MKKLQLAPGLSLPLDFVSRTAGILAVRGAGKSNTAAVMAEEMFAAGLPFVVIDPVGSWYGLRSSADGTAPGLPIPIFGGRHGDVPLERGAGELLADLVVDKRLTCVLDLSQFGSEADKKAFLLSFARRLYQRNENPLHLFLEEADDYIPQAPMADERHLLRAFENIVRRGRARGLGMTLITQRSAAVSKMVLTQVETLFAMRTTGPQDIAAIEAWVKYHQVGKDMLASLAGLDDGEAWVWSPHYLRTMARHQIRLRRTFDSGATPTNLRAKDRRPPATLADIDLTAITAQMAATLERAKADDPKELRRQLAEKDRRIQDLERAATTASAGAKPEVVPVLSDADRERLAALERQFVEAAHALGAGAVDLLARFEAQLRQAVGGVLDEFHEAGERLHEQGRLMFVAALDDAGFATVLEQLRACQSAGAQTSTPRTGTSGQATRPLASTGRQAPARGSVAAAGDLSPAEGRMLDILAAHPEGLDRTELAIRAGYAAGGGGFRNTLSALHTRGLIEKSGSRVTWSSSGASRYASQRPSPMTASEVQDVWRRKLSPAEWRMLEALIAVHPRQLSRADLATRCGYEVSGGGFRNTLSALSVNNLVQKSGGMVSAAEVLCR